MLNPNNYPEDVITAALFAKDGVQNISFRYDLLNLNNIKIGVINNMTSAAVSYNEFNTIKRTAAFNIDEAAGDGLEINYLSDRIQPWFILNMPDGGAVEWPLGIYLLESPSKSLNGTSRKRSIKAYDKSLILDQYHCPTVNTSPPGRYIRRL